MATEQTFGTPVAPTTFLPQLTNAMTTEPGLFFPKVALGVRDVNIFALYGENKHAGNLSGPLFPSNGLAVVSAAIGHDGPTGSGVTGTNPTAATTIANGDPTLVGGQQVTLTSVTGYTVGNIVQIDVNATTTTSECRKITAIAGSTLTLDAPLAYGHAAGAAVAVVTAPFTHTLMPVGSPDISDSLTVEKVYGSTSAYSQSLQFAGSRVVKFDLKAATGDTEVNYTADMLAKSAAVLNPASPISVVNESPFVFAEANLSLFGEPVAQITNVELSVNNGTKATYTFNGSHDPQFVTPINREVTAKVDLVYSSLDDATWGYYELMRAQTQGALDFSFVHPNSGGSMSVSLPHVNIGPYHDEIKVDDVILTSLEMTASFSLVDQHSIIVTVVNNEWLPA